MLVSQTQPGAHELPAPLVAKEPKAQDVAQALQELDLDQMTHFLEEQLPELVSHLKLPELIKEIQELDRDFKSAQLHAQRHTPFSATPNRDQALAAEHSYLVAELFRIATQLVDTFASAISFYDEADPPASIYEKQVLITIWYRLFQIPLALLTLFSPVVYVAWRAHALAAVTMIATVGSAIAYRKWLRPFPNAIACCDILRGRVSRDYPQGIEGLEDEREQLARLLDSTGRKGPILVLGPTGGGKTTLQHKLQLWIEADENVPESLRGNTIVCLQGGKLMVKEKHAFAEKLKQIRSALSGFESKVVIHIDELQAVAADARCLELMKDFIRNSGLRCVASTTWDGFEQIAALDIDRSFRRSFGAKLVSVGNWSEHQVEAVLEGFACEAWDLRFSKSALARIVELTSGSLKSLGQPAKAIELLETVISDVRARFEVTTSKALKKQQDELALYKRQWKREYPQDSGQAARARLEHGIADRLEKLQQKRAKRLRLRRIMDLFRQIKQETINSALTLKSHPEAADAPEQLRYLLNYFYLLPALNKWIEHRAQAEKLYVDNEIIDAAFKEYEGVKAAVNKIVIGPFAGIIEQPTQDHFNEVSEAMRLGQSVGQGLGEPTFDTLLRQRWDSQSDRLSKLFLSFSDYSQIVCQACESGWEN